MKHKSIALLLTLAWILTACAIPAVTATAPVTENPSLPYPAASEAPVGYPPPIVQEPTETSSAYPAPGTPAATPVPVIPPSGFEPQPGDANLKQDKAEVNVSESVINVTATDPSHVEVVLKGTLSDPCHQLRVVVTPPDAQSTFNMNVYSVLDPKVACITVINPFTATIPLGSYTGGHYVVMVNSQRLGEFNAGFKPQPGDSLLTRGEASVDMTASKLIIIGSKPTEANALLIGNVPDPCHQLRIAFSPADSQNRINLEVYTVFDPHTACITLIQTFQVNYPLGMYSSGHYTVYVNGQLLGEFGQ